MTQASRKTTPSRWVKVAVDYYRNPKIISVGIFGEVAFLRLLAIARERVEISAVDGSVPYVLAVRELRDIADGWGQGTVDDLLNTLVSHQLILIDGDTVIVDDYRKWQTTKDEIASSRDASRTRASSSRTKSTTKNPKENDHPKAEALPKSDFLGNAPTATAADSNSGTQHDAPDRVGVPLSIVPSSNSFSSTSHKKSDKLKALSFRDDKGTKTQEVAAVTAGRTRTATMAAHNQTPDEADISFDTSHGSGERNDTMGVYDQQVAPFTDLRDTEKLTQKNKKVGWYGLEQQYMEPVEEVAQHILAARKQTLGAAARPRIGSTWRGIIQNMLRGTTVADVAFTSDQLCDIYDFATQDSFWHFVQDPATLKKHAHKLFVSDSYIAWSIRKGRPEENRPRNTTHGAGTVGTGKFKGELAADTTTDYSSWDGEL